MDRPLNYLRRARRHEVSTNASGETYEDEDTGRIVGIYTDPPAGASLLAATLRTRPLQGAASTYVSRGVWELVIPVGW